MSRAFSSCGRHLFLAGALGLEACFPGKTTSSPPEADASPGAGLATFTLVDAGTSADLYSVWGSGPNDVYAVGGFYDLQGPATILHWNGSAWSPVSTGLAQPSVDGIAYTCVWGSGANDVWVVGDTTGTAGPLVIAHWDGEHWDSLPSANDGGTAAGYASSVWGTSSSDVWFAFGDVPTHWDGSSWTAFPSVNGSSLWGSSPSAVWATSSGQMEYWDATGWTPYSLGVETGATGVWGASADDVWAVGGQLLFHWNGSTWSPVPGAGIASLAAVWGSGSDDVWAVGATGTSPQAVYDEPAVLHWDGATWSPVAIGTGAWLQAVWGSDAGDVWFVGARGTLVHRVVP